MWSERKMLRRLVRCVIGLALLIPLLATAASYVYDANGRLRAVTSSTGASSEYIYDALGNIYAINAVPAGQLTIFAFTPSHGSVGTSITIFGQGFSTTKSQDLVKFNGTTATVATVTATQLKVTVPAGATTGTISVQVGTATATSIDLFTVTSDAGTAPVISSFTPAVIDHSGTVTVNGSHFIATAGVTTSALGELNGTVSSLTDAQLSLTASADAASGYITVTTPYGSAKSAQPLIVLPTGISASQIVGVDYLSVGGAAQTLNINSANSYGAYVFQGIAGQFLSLQFTTATPTGGVAYTVYDPLQNSIVSSAVSSNEMSIHLPVLTATGTYVILFASGSGTALVTGNLAADSFVILDGSSVPLSTTTAGQSLRPLFKLSASKTVSVGFNSVSSTSGAAPLGYIYAPESQLPRSPLSYPVWSFSDCPPIQGGCHMIFYSPPSTGTYSAIIKPNYSTDTMSMSLTLSSPVRSTLTLGSAKSVNLSRAGQIALLTFTGTAGDLMGSYLNLVSTLPTGGIVKATVLNTDGSLPPGPYWGSQAYTSAFENYIALPTSATYQLLVEPQYSQTATLQVTVAKNPVKTLVTDAATSAVTTLFPGQNAYIRFTGSIGQNVSLGISNLTLNPSVDPGVHLLIHTPDGALYLDTSVDSRNGGGHIDLLDLPQAGTYSITASGSNETASFNIGVMNAVSGSLTLGSAKPVTLNKPGQIALYTLSANAGDFMGAYLNNVVTNPVNALLIGHVLNLDGSPLTYSYFGFQTQSSAFTNFEAFQTTGPYEVLSEPQYAETVSAQLTLVANPTYTTSINGAAVNVTASYPGEYAYLFFAGTAGQNVRFSLSNIANSPATNISYTVSASTGRPFYYGACNVSGCLDLLPALPANDTYRIAIYPQESTSTLSATAALISP